MKTIFTLLLIFFTLGSHSQSLVISQVYGAGGNGTGSTAAVYKNDFVELFNPTGVAINVNNWSVQYNNATSTTTTWQRTILPDISILPGQYFLIQQAQGSGGTENLTPDFIGNIIMSALSGKMVLVSDTNFISVACPTINVIDKVGYGTPALGTINCFEGSGSTPAFDNNKNALFRKDNGCTDSDNNAVDFEPVTAAPRNTSSPLHSCGAVAPSLLVSVTSLPDFGLITAGLSSEPLSFDLSGNDLIAVPGDITITSLSADFEISNDNLTWGEATTIAYTSSSLNSTTVYVRFTPQSVGEKTGNISVTGGGVSTLVTVAVSGAGLASFTPLVTASNLNNFGNICLNATSGPNLFTIGGDNLTADSVTVGPLTGYRFATTSTGTYSTSIKLAQPGGTYFQEVFVKFIPVLLQSYNGNIPVSGGGITDTLMVPAKGTGANAAPLATTELANGITASKATLAGLIANTGCTAITAYGFEYSSVSGFGNGEGTVINASNEITGNFSVEISGILASTTYYFKAFAVNGGGKSYGLQRSFKTLICVPPSGSTAKAIGITTNIATLPGVITAIGCSAVSEYGIQYATVINFNNGFPVKVASNNAANNNFSVTLSGLTQNTKYFYRAFATNTGGTSFFGVDSFTTRRIAPGLVVYANPVRRGGAIRYTLDNLKNEDYAAQLITSFGQIVYQKNITVQVGFIDDNFIVPVNLPAGVYVLKVLSLSGFETKRSLLIL